MCAGLKVQLSVRRVLSQLANDHLLLLNQRCGTVITPASSLTVFRRKLKTHLFQQLYPDIMLLVFGVVAMVVLAVIYSEEHDFVVTGQN